ncbi:hydrogenase [Sphaerotilus mobilis]|uniref:Hydrogenase-1 operon protein HyaE n=1 Tax=Sphaerotilus mobilis TaxID=47994 RepID=A0A4Q7LTU9_9BURK|nr:hydrogenase [Sphaerotilus mobilis]RZS57881.1 hydrogenase-1 operon protein HyaE [Sphaerotilus mobilis]
MTLDILDAPQTLDPPTQDPAAGSAPLVCRLVTQHGAVWATNATLDTVLAQPGDQVLFFHGDPVRFPEVLDVAVVLPELQRVAARPFGIAVACRADEDALARRFASTRWPALVFLRDGQYVGVIAGMHDWTDYVAQVAQMLSQPTRRVPGVGIPLVAAGQNGPACH